jgi:AcrR family transcriptional regulator
VTARIEKAKRPSDAADSGRERLLKVATELFALRGLEGVTIRELAEAAAVNVAAVHYHFGGKGELYAAVIEQVFSPLSTLLATTEPFIEKARASGDPKVAREALEDCIRALMTRLFANENPSLASTFLARESIQPSSAMARVFDCFVQPTWTTFLSVLALIRPDLAGTEELRFIASSVVGQCLYYPHARPIALATFQLKSFDSSFVERAIAHIARFSYAAIEASSFEGRTA